MTRFLPKSLFGQTLLILLVGLVVSHVIGAWIYAGAREQAVRAIGGYAAAQRVANLSRLVEEAPPDWRPRIVQARIADYLARLMDEGVLRRGDPAIAAQQLKDLSISGVYQVRLWGVIGDPTPEEVAVRVSRAVDTFLRAYRPD